MGLYLPPVPLGGSFAASSAIGALITLLAPAANTKGAILRSASLVTSGGMMTLYADTAAPASQSDTTKRAILSGFGATASGYQSMALPNQLLLPAGVGLYAWNNGTSGAVWVSYDLV